MPGGTRSSGLVVGFEADDGPLAAINQLLRRTKVAQEYNTGTLPEPYLLLEAVLIQDLKRLSLP